MATPRVSDICLNWQLETPPEPRHFISLIASHILWKKQEGGPPVLARGTKFFYIGPSGKAIQSKVLPYQEGGINIDSNGLLTIDNLEETERAMCRYNETKKADFPTYIDTTYVIVQIAGHLFSLSKDSFTIEGPEKFEFSLAPLASLYIQCNSKAFYRLNQDLDRWWPHLDLVPYHRELINTAFQPNSKGVPRIFLLTFECGVLMFQQAKGEYQPSQIIDPRSGNHYFLYLAGERTGKAHRALMQLILDFSEDFERVKNDVLEKLFSNPHLSISLFADSEDAYIEILESFRPSLPPFSHLLLDIMKREAVSLDRIENLPDPEKERAYSVARAFYNPFIHQPANREIAAGCYTINLLWINKEKVAPDQMYLMQDPTTHATLVRTVTQWASLNPQTPVQIWYDSVLTTQACIDNTFKEISKQLTDNSIVTFCDIRSLSLVDKHPKAFSPDIAYSCLATAKPEACENSAIEWTIDGDQVSAPLTVYFRANLLRAIILDNELRNRTYAVYADLDVKALEKRLLFDKQAMEDLDHFGCVFSGFTYASYENSFQIWCKAQPAMTELHRQMIINEHIGIGETSPLETLLDEQLVYEAYLPMLEEFWGKKQPDETRETKMPIPRKMVYHPPSRFGGGMSAPYSKAVPICRTTIPYS